MDCHTGKGGKIVDENRMRPPPSPARSRTRGHRTATAPMPVMISRSGRCPWRTSRRRPDRPPIEHLDVGRSDGINRLRAGVRLIPEGRPANRSLSAIEPVSATAKRKLENGEQRPAPETFPARAEIPKITDQRLGRASLTRGNVAGSHTPGNNTTETRLPG